MFRARDASPVKTAAILSTGSGCGPHCRDYQSGRCGRERRWTPLPGTSNHPIKPQRMRIRAGKSLNSVQTRAAIASGTPTKPHRYHLDCGLSITPLGSKIEARIAAAQNARTPPAISHGAHVGAREGATDSTCVTVPSSWTRCLWRCPRCIVATSIVPSRSSRASASPRGSSPWTLRTLHRRVSMRPIVFRARQRRIPQ